ncbi:hypothetical protein ACFWPA_18120 [Rhodococcus sp. NPDC058505]|uniref:hypothetical protein n=1 Tax=Rhodococcus sp. NPDC058505 TaxID=3346531 RepID=UPI00364C0F56
MLHSRFTVRAAAVAALGGAVVVGAPALAITAPIDVQPTPLGCQGGVATVQSLTHTDNDGIEPDDLLFVVNEQGRSGPDVNWINITTGETGADRMTPTEEILNAPAVLVEPEGGVVLSAVWGPYENATGENCFLLPGIDVTELAGEPDD